IDAANRAAFEECFAIIKRAWTEDLIDVDGRYWKVPVAGTPWDLDATARYGAGVEDGLVRQVAVVPKPLQQPHPPLFQPFASSERSIRWCAQEGVTAILPPLHPLLESRLMDVSASQSGLPRGEGMGVLRDLVIADTDEEAWTLWAEGPRFCGEQWFAPFGFDRGLAHPETGEPPDYAEGSLMLVGTVDTVTRQLERLLERLPVTWLFAWQYNGLTPHAAIMRTIEDFATKVLPRVS
ncbi:MAG: LLM class flavin-dependent oxidoreductase, partial [Acidimicrobiaceae bacterium]|nr:LLM class flavin-dependent oxidoreductase [Acidimicrobiaceae bacterium]